MNLLAENSLKEKCRIFVETIQSKSPNQMANYADTVLKSLHIDKSPRFSTQLRLLVSDPYKYSQLSKNARAIY